MATARASVRFEFQPERFKELILYIAHHCREDPTFGAIKLNKILYFSDFAAYRMLGQPITGATYFKLIEGPAPRQMLQARDDLIREGRIDIERRPYFNGVQSRVVVTGSGPNAEEFTAAERQIIDSVSTFFWGKTAREVSDFSHLQPGCILAKDREDIPYETAWLGSDPISQWDEEIGRQMAEQYDRATR